MGGLCGHRKSLNWKLNLGEKALAAPGTRTSKSITPWYFSRSIYPHWAILHHPLPLDHDPLAETEFPDVEGTVTEAEVIAMETGVSKSPNFRSQQLFPLLPRRETKLVQHLYRTLRHSSFSNGCKLLACLKATPTLFGSKFQSTQIVTFPMCDDESRERKSYTQD